MSPKTNVAATSASPQVNGAPGGRRRPTAMHRPMPPTSRATETANATTRLLPRERAHILNGRTRHENRRDDGVLPRVPDGYTRMDAAGAGGPAVLGDRLHGCLRHREERCRVD